MARCAFSFSEDIRVIEPSTNKPCKEKLSMLRANSWSVVN